MGTLENPIKSISEVFHRYAKTLETLSFRVLAEPYHFHGVSADIHPKMLIGTHGEVIAECQKQFDEARTYTPQSVALALNRDRASLLSWTQKDAEVDLPAAFDMFKHAYGQYVEHQIAESVGPWIREGLSSEEIAIKSDTMRRDAGMAKKKIGNDGKEEFEKELIQALDGKVVDYPVKPFLADMRQAIPYHDPGEYVVVGARTGMGKSYYALNQIFDCAKKGLPSVYINLENSPKNVQRRLWQMETGIQWRQDLSKEDLKKAMYGWEAVKNFPVESINTGRSLQTVLNTIRQSYYEKGIQLAVIDYVQLIKDGNQRRGKTEEIGEVSAELRALALELQIPVIALAQINREAEKTGNKRPTISDLRNSGDLEQDASTILLLYRPSVYESMEVDENGIAYPANYADITIGKGRDTGRARIICRFDPVRGFYSDPDFLHSTAPTDYTIPASAMSAARANDEDIPF